MGTRILETIQEEFQSEKELGISGILLDWVSYIKEYE
jgi:hypothetical protein